MKKIITVVLFCCCLFVFSKAQNVGIGTNTPHSNAILDVSSTNKGLLLPRLADTNAVSGVKPAGLTIYSNIDNKLYFYNGTKWQSSTAATGGDSLWYLRNDSIAYTNKKYVGINSDLSVMQPQATLQITGSMLAQAPTTISTGSPTMTVTMNNSSILQPVSGNVIRIFDPGGYNNNYINNTQGNILVESGFSQSLGYTVSFNKMDFGLSAGDTLWVSQFPFPECRVDNMLMLTNTTLVPDSILVAISGTSVVNRPIFYISFRSNGDNQNDRGFDITLRKVTEIFEPIKPVWATGKAFYFNATSGAVRGGRLIGGYKEGEFSTAIGAFARASGFSAAAFGDGIANGNRSFSAGSSIANGSHSGAFGSLTTAEGFGSFVAGGETKAIGNFSTAIGYGTQANTQYSLAVGIYNDTLEAYTGSSPTETSPLFTIGNGSNNTMRRNAFVVRKDGKTGIGNVNPQTPLHIFENTSELIRLESIGLSSAISFWGAISSSSRAEAGRISGATSFSNSPGMLISTNHDQIRLNVNGQDKFIVNNFGINANSSLNVQGYTRLGEFGAGSPSIKLKEITGQNTSAFDGGGSNFPHGLTRSKIIAVNIIVDAGGPGEVTHSYTYSPGFEFNIAFDNSSIYVYNKTGNCFSILNKPMKVLITYKE